ncbi:MAG: xanthine dehydrogenase family protein [Calditrichia bacterium]|nr:xanthine dehydrogenase family protein [Calditrichia bacterium]
MKSNPKDIRVDALDKLQANVNYIRDEKIPDMWYGGTIRSLHARAEILSIKQKSGFDWSKVTVVTAKDIPVNYVAIIEQDMPYLADKITNYVGEPVALIGAPGKELLEEAVKHIEVEYHPLPALLDFKTSENNNIKIFKEHNLFKKILIEKGDLRKAQDEAAGTIKIEVETGYQEQLYIEPQGVIAIPEEDKITIKGSMQCPYYVKKSIEILFENKKHITVIQSTTGGAFGGKEDFPSLIAGHASLLAVKCGHPVSIFYEREEDIRVTTKRHPSFHKDTAYVDKSGKILGLYLNFLFDGGAYSTLSQVVLSRGALTSLGSYYVPHVKVIAKAVATNTPPAGAFRGFGAPQALFAIEMLIEKIAFKLNKSPKEIRKINLIKEGQTTATGQELKYSVSSHETFEDVLLESDYGNKYTEYYENNRPILEKLKTGNYPKSNSGDMLKGIGITSFLHGAGFTGTGENRIKGKIKVEIDQQGRPVIFAAITEMGQGKDTAFRKMMADALYIDIKDVVLAPVNTDIVPDSGPTVASRSTMIVGSLIVDAAKELLNQLHNKLKENTGTDFEYKNGYFYGDEHTLSFKEAALKFPDISIMKQYEHPSMIKFNEETYKGDAYPVYSWAAAVAEVEGDPVTF